MVRQEYSVWFENGYRHELVGLFGTEIEAQAAVARCNLVIVVGESKPYYRDGTFRITYQTTTTVAIPVKSGVVG